MQVGGDDRLGVPGSEPANVVNRLIEVRHYLDAENEIEKLPCVVLIGCGPDPLRTQHTSGLLVTA